MRIRRASLVAAAVVGAGFAACLPSRPEGDVRKVYDRDDAGGEADATFAQDGGTAGPAVDAAGTIDDPRALVAVDPPHGPFTGGQRAVVQGSGYAGKMRVFFGDVEVPPAEIVALSSKKLQVNVPPGAPGDVDVRVQQGDDPTTARTLKSAYTYDAFALHPSDGPTSGGTVVEIVGAGTIWGPDTTVSIGGKPCTNLTIQGPTALGCQVPAHTPGAKPVTITSGGAAASVLDAFTYSDSDNGFRGGLSGKPLSGTIRVLAFDSMEGKPLEGATVFLGETTDGLKATVDAAGVTIVTDPSLTGRVNVTIARKCSQPQSFVAVPVDTVTAYLDPILSPECMPPEGDPPPVGGKPGLGASVEGEIVFEGKKEFDKGQWSGVPAPLSPGERKVAYLFFPSSDPRARFTLPPASSAILESSPGANGYGFTTSAPVGNVAAYALAGLEDRTKTPPTFTAYLLGVTRGISTKPGVTTGDVAISIDIPLDQKVTVSLDPPSPGPKGPDRVAVAVATTLGNYGYAILPGAQRTTLLPVSGALSFVGLPPLGGLLEGQAYVTSAQAGTGSSLSLPISSVAKVLTTSASQVVTIDGFVAVPRLDTPSLTASWDAGSFAISLGGGADPDVIVLDVESGGGLVGWMIAAPGGVTSFRLPDLRAVKGAGLVPGNLTAKVSAARVRAEDAASGGKFDYGELRYRHLDPRGWTAYAQDYSYAALSQ
ncbi:MAG: IPT/TIG domain-containing protein [Polyangiaceae bacterium]|nr:IPT/TIG domain-containing protein [Polyangiaceae bacterium]